MEKLQHDIGTHYHIDPPDAETPNPLTRAIEQLRQLHGFSELAFALACWQIADLHRGLFGEGGAA